MFVLGQDRHSDDQSDRPIRVLQVFASLDRGGAEQVVMNWYRTINRDRIQFDFTVNSRTREYAHESEIRALGGRVFRIPKPKPWTLPRYWRTWRELLARHPEWDVIHVHHSYAGFLFIPLIKRMGRTTIVHSHNAGRDPGFKSLIKVQSRRPLRHLADQTIACSKAASKWMFGDTGGEVILNGIDLAAYRFDLAQRARARQELDIKDQLVIGHVGRFNTQKNHGFLIAIFREVVNIAPDAVLLLVGDGNLRPTIEERVSQLGLSGNVRFLGVRSDINRLLNAMDVFLFPSLYEGLGVVLVEAQANGLPCVVSDTVPQEVKINPDVQFLPLSAPASEWAKAVTAAEVPLNERVARVSLLEDGPFDANVGSKRLVEIYESLTESI